MAKWLTDSTRELIRQLAEQGLPRARIQARLGITRHQVDRELKRIGFKPERERWGMVCLYYKLQGKRRKK